MTVTDETVMDVLDGSDCFPIEEIVHYPLPGYGAPTSVAFSPDDSLVTYLYSSENTLNRNLFSFDPTTGKQDLLFNPPGGGLDEDNLSAEEKLRRERLRERGLGVTRYEWVKTGPHENAVMVPLPAGIYFQNLSSQPQLKLQSAPTSPVIDPHLSPDGSMLSYVRDNELHVLDLLQNESKQITFGADGKTLTHGVAEYIAQVR
nr:PREDICTED: dipeptidyl aminopeptidase 4-like isoform X2 [Daucus carota subsp. sativus]XP_017228172.1 PREDICTED: dipeptidyl aminopeptidase 4-like isoform X2 [Daucus carota subsp. sativus]